MTHNLGIATRFYGLTPEDCTRLGTWVDAALKVTRPEHILVAIHVEADKSGSLAFLKEHYPAVQAFPVTPWGRVVQAPNALLIKGAGQGVEHLLVSSTEYPIEKQLAERLLAHMDSETLVVGARLATHDFKADQGATNVIEHASGKQIPWNTFALWSLAHLVHTGFVLTADSFHDEDNAGMEEMGTIAAQQILWPGRAKAKLVAPAEGELIHNTHGWTIDRQVRSQSIHESKNARSLAQLERLALPAPSVLHIGS